MAVFEALEKGIWRGVGIVEDTELRVILEQSCWRWTAIIAGELIPNGLNGHCAVPSCMICIVADLETVFDDAVEKVEDCAVDIGVAQEVFFLPLEIAVDLGLFSS